MAAATDLKRPLILPAFDASALTHTFTDDNSPSQVAITINDQVGYFQSGIPTNQISSRFATQSNFDDDSTRTYENPYAIIGSDGFEASGSATVVIRFNTMLPEDIQKSMA